VLELLGKGSMGMVFLACDPVLERNVAIKVMSGSSVGDAKLRERFEREAKAVAKLHHPNIVTVHDLGYDEEGSPFIAMEVLEGSDLHDLMEARPLRLAEKLEIIMQVCRGLTHAHEKGIVHRDIKPANIFVTREGTAKIMDFGVSRWMRQTQTQAGLVVGTAGYISPEQLRGKPVDERADIFSLGVVLFEILTNEVLFSGDTIETVFFKTLGRETPILLAASGEEIPALQGVVRRALAKDVAERYRSAEALRDALHSFADTHRALLGESAPFTTRERGQKAADEPTRSERAPTRIVRSAAESAVRRRPSGQTATKSRPPSRSRGAFAASALGAFVLAGGIGAYVALREKAVTSSSPLPAPAAAQSPASPIADGAALVADAALALGRGNLGEAKRILDEGEKAYPGNPRWSELRGQLRAREAEEERRKLAARRVEEGRLALDRGDSRAAVAAFTRAVESDPANTEATAGLDRAIALAKKDAAARKSEPAPPPPRKYVESRTSFTPVASSPGELHGFEAEPGIEVGETRDALFPAQLLLELSPQDAKPGQTYTLTVSLFNEGYRAVEVRSLELVNRFEGKASGKGQPIPLLARVVEPQATLRIYQVSGTWKEALDHGEIEATVTLQEGKLTKSLRW
jgi:serine/threonine-protein kinase